MFLCSDHGPAVPQYAFVPIIAVSVSGCVCLSFIDFVRPLVASLSLYLSVSFSLSLFLCLRLCLSLLMFNLVHYPSLSLSECFLFCVFHVTFALPFLCLSLSLPFPLSFFFSFSFLLFGSTALLLDYSLACPPQFHSLTLSLVPPYCLTCQPYSLPDCY